MQILVYGSETHIYLYVQHYRLIVEVLQKNLNFKKEKKIALAMVWPAGDCFITRPLFSLL